MFRLIFSLVVIQTSAVAAFYHATNDTSGDVLSSKNVSATDTSNTGSLQGKHQLFMECIAFDLEPGEYEIFLNGTAYVEQFNRTYNESFYRLVGDLLRVCAPTIDEKRDVSLTTASFELNYLTTLGLAVSMICLLLHLVVFAIVPDLRNLPGYNLASLCSSLFLGYLFWMIGSHERVKEANGICIASAALTQFFLLGSLLWMTVMAFDVFRSLLHATGSLRVSSKQFKVKKFIFYSIFSWGIALTFTAAALVADRTERVPEEYLPAFGNSCWFENKQSLLAFFAGPAFTVICLNFIFFGLSAYVIFVNRMKSDQDNRRSVLQKSYLMYFRLSVIMGVTWITGVLAPSVHNVWLWYVFAALNTLQGLFIFLAFTCTSKVKKYLREKLLGGRRSSEQILTTPTFQSYCYYAASIEKDLNKMVDKEKAETDHIIIHL